MSTIRVNTVQDASGVERYLARAWVNFNGTGTVAIRASGNVSSITDNGTGNYTVNFTTAMPDVNYSTVGTCGGRDGSFGANTVALLNVTYSVNNVRVGSFDNAFALADTNNINVAIFR